MLIYTPLQQILKLLIIALLVWSCDTNTSNEIDINPMPAIDMNRPNQNDQNLPSSVMDQGDSTITVDQGVDPGGSTVPVDQGVDPGGSTVSTPEQDTMMTIDEEVPTSPSESQLTWNVPNPIRGMAGNTQVVEVKVHLNNLPRSVAGWTLALTTDRSQRCLIRELITPQTLAAPSDSDEIGLRQGGIDNHRIFGGGVSALSEVILSLTEDISVMPPTSPHPILRFLLQVTLPAVNSSTSCMIRLDSSLRVGSRHIESILVSEGQSYPIQVEPLEIEIIAE